MAAPLNTGASSGSVNPGTSITFSHVVAAGANQVLYVFLMVGSATSAWACTYGGVAMTLVASINDGTGNISKLFQLISPTVGTANVVVSWTSSNSALAVSASYSGVNQITPNRTIVTANGTNSSPSSTVTSETGTLVVDFVYSHRASALETLTVGAGQAQQVNAQMTGATNNVAAISQEAGAASVVMDWTTLTEVGQTWNQMALSLNVLSSSGFFLFF